MLKIIHSLIGHNEIVVDSIEIEGGELRLYACSCGKTSWKKNYRLGYLAQKDNIGKDIVDIFKRENPLLKSLLMKRKKRIVSK